MSGLKLPKAEKGAEEDATFPVNADVYTAVADMAEGGDYKPEGATDWCDDDATGGDSRPVAHTSAI